MLVMLRRAACRSTAAGHDEPHEAAMPTPPPVVPAKSSGTCSSSPGWRSSLAGERRARRDAGAGRAGPEDRGRGRRARLQLRDAGSAVGDVPLVGDKVRSPFDGAGRAADQIAAAGTAQVEAVQHLAFWLGLTVGALPILLVGAGLPAAALAVRPGGDGRTALRRRVGRPGPVRAAGDGHQPMHRLARISDDPVAGLAVEGDPDVVRALAVLELEGHRADPALTGCGPGGLGRMGRMTVPQHPPQQRHRDPAGRLRGVAGPGRRDTGRRHGGSRRRLPAHRHREALRQRGAASATRCATPGSTATRCS